MPPKDISGGGGGGGGGGAGGNGGTVDYHYCFKADDGTMRAAGGAGGSGGQDAGSPCCNDYGAPAIGHGEGCNGGAPNGGAGGDAEHETGCAGDGDGGGSGATGAPGSVRPFFHCPGYDHDDFDVLRYKLDLDIQPYYPEHIGGSNIIQVRCLADGLDSFGFRLDQVAFGDETQVSIGPHWDGPWTPLVPGVDWDWGDDQITACVILDPPYNMDDVFYLSVEYGGRPRTEGEDGNGGMFFTSHGTGADERVLVATTVEPWHAYRWLPVKDDGGNWNCDKATAEMS